MKQLHIFLSLLICMLALSVSAHQDFYVPHKTDNVTLTILTGFEFEEINKCRLVTNQVADLCKILGYKKKIRIDFEHEYLSAPNPEAVFISVDKWQIIDQYASSPFKPKAKEKARIYLRVISDQIPVATVLKAIRFAIENETEIEECQQQYKVQRQHVDWTIYSMAPNEIANRLSTINLSDLWPNLSKKYYAIDKREGGELTYYLQRDSFCVFYQQNESLESEFFCTTKLFQISASTREFNFGLIFITRLSLVSISYFSDDEEISKVSSIPNGWISDYPMNVIFLGRKRAIIPMSLPSLTEDSAERRSDVLYDHDQQAVIEDIDGVLRKLFEKH